MMLSETLIGSSIDRVVEFVFVESRTSSCRLSLVDWYAFGGGRACGGEVLGGVIVLGDMEAELYMLGSLYDFWDGVAWKIFMDGMKMDGTDGVFAGALGG